MVMFPYTVFELKMRIFLQGRGNQGILSKAYIAVRRTKKFRRLTTRLRKKTILGRKLGHGDEQFIRVFKGLNHSI